MAAEELVERICGIPGSPTKLVFLSACESAAGGDKSLTSALLKGGIPCILAMKEPVSVDVTKTLSSAFYAALGAGMTIAEAFKFAIPTLSRLPDMPEAGTKARDIPILLGDGVKERLVTSPKRGSVTMNQERLPGVPEYDFVGEYIRDNPPRGRKGLLLQIERALLDGEKLVVLTGQGGIGKSVLASVAARRIAWQYPGGVFWRSAADAETLGLNELLDAFVSVFGYEFRTRALDAKRDAVQSYLGDLETPSLIVVDNAEKISDPALWSFLEGLPQPSAALVASRDALTREGLHINVPKMEYEESIGIFEEEDSHFNNRKPGLFVSASCRANNQRWGERLSSKEMDNLIEIDRLLDGHPLGIKLAAALTASDSLEAICEKLRASPPKEVSDRFDFSYNTLTRSQKELLHRMAAFVSSVREWAIGAICTEHFFEGDEAKLLQDWRTDLSELVRKSFVDVIELSNLDETEKEGMRRYRLHPLMNQYASIKAGDMAMQAHRCRTSHLFLSYAQNFCENFDTLGDEHHSILAGGDWAYAAKKWEMVKRYTNAIAPYLRHRGYWKEERQILERAVKSSEELGDRVLMASSLHDLGVLTQNTGNPAEAKRFYRDSLKIERELGNNSDVAHTLWHLATLTIDNGENDEARRLYEEILEIEMELDDKSGIANTLGDLGSLARANGDLAEARKKFLDALEIEKELGNDEETAALRHNLGTLACEIGDFAEARRLFEYSLKIDQDNENKKSMTGTLRSLGSLAEEMDNLTEAKKFYQESLKIEQELGYKWGNSWSLYNLGRLAQKNGELEQAKRLYRESLKIKQELGNKSEVAKLLDCLGELAQETDDIDEAKMLFQQSLEIYKELDDKRYISHSLKHLGELAQDVEDARSLYLQSLEIDKKLNNKNGIGFSLASLALLEETEGNIKAALDLMVQAKEIFEESCENQNVKKTRKQIKRLKGKMA